MSIRPPVAAHKSPGYSGAQVRAIFRNLIAKALTYFARHEVEHLRLMSEHLLDCTQDTSSVSSEIAYRLRSVSFLLDKQATAPGNSYQETLKEALQQEVQTALDKALVPDHDESEGADVLDGMTLSLIDVAEMDRLLAVDVTTQRFNSHYEAQLAPLNQRLGVLLGGEILPLSANPFRPEVWVRALMQAWKRSGFEDAVCDDLLVHLVPKGCLDLRPLYEDLNASLTQAGISDKTTHRIRKNADNEGGVAGPSTDLGALSGNAPLSGFGGYGPSEYDTGYGGFPGAEDHANTSAAEGPGTEFASPPSHPSHASGTLGHSIAVQARHFLSMLGLGAHDASESTLAHASEWARAPADPTLLGYLDGLQDENSTTYISELGQALEHTGQNLLRHMRDLEQVRLAPEIDRGTVDALAEVFDYVFADQGIPAELKVLIGRLQIPVLKAAMIDREFFRSDQHPARKLVDALAQAAVTWNADKGEQDPLYQQIDRTVHRALSEFEDQLSLFEELLAEFSKFVSQSEQDALQHIAPVAKVEQSDEAMDMARIQADEVVHDRLKAVPETTPLAPLLLPFLTLQWREVLAQAWLKVRTQPDAWNGALTTMDQLIWSTQPQTVQVERRQRSRDLAPHPNERRQLMRVLPALIHSLEEGLNSIRWSGPPREDFMRGLMDLHMQVVRVAAPTPQEQERHLVEALAAKEAMRALDERRAQQKADPLDEFENLAHGFSRGMWFDYLNDKVQLYRCRLTWISPKRTRLLFTNRDGYDAFVRSEREVVELLREGRLTAIDQAPIVGRALDQLMATED